MVSKEDVEQAKRPLIFSEDTTKRVRDQRRIQIRVLSTFLVVCILNGVISFIGRHYNRSTASKQPICPQTTALIPEKNAGIAKKLSQLYVSDEFRADAIAWLSGAVKVP